LCCFVFFAGTFFDAGVKQVTVGYSYKSFFALDMYVRVVTRVTIHDR
jgi:hypothetical protein